MKKYWFSLVVLLCWFSQMVFAVNRIMMQTVKLDPVEFGEQRHVLYTCVAADGIKAGYFKGPGMTDYEAGVWSEGHAHWYFEHPFITLSQLQAELLGTWEIKLVHDNNAESVYTTNVIGPLEDAMFLLVPKLIGPEHDASDVIAEHCTFTWDPNTADAAADDLWIVIAGDGFFYFDSTLDMTATSWDPGWLEIGDAFCRLSYVDYRPDMISEPVWLSGPEITWDVYIACIMSGDKHSFTVKYSLDFNEDDVINLADVAVVFSHWLEIK